MSHLSTSVPPTFLSQAFFRRFSVSEYHRMIETRVLTDEDHVELLNGHVVLKMPRNPPHDNTIAKLAKRLNRLLPGGWEIRNQSAITLAESEPEPDLAIVRGDETTFAARPPVPEDIGLLIEVANSTLLRDRTDKLRIYAAAGIIEYWIVNLIDLQVEVHQIPSGPSASPVYGQKSSFGLGDDLPFQLDGMILGSISVAEIVG